MHDGRAINDKACKCISVLVSKVSGPNVGGTAGYLGCIHILPFQTVFLRDEKLRQYNCRTSSAKTTTGLIIKIKPPQRAPGFEASFCRRPDHVITSTCDVLCLESTGLQNPVLNISRSHICNWWRGSVFPPLYYRGGAPPCTKLGELSLNVQRSYCT